MSIVLTDLFIFYSNIIRPCRGLRQVRPDFPGESLLSSAPQSRENQKASINTFIVLCPERIR